MLCPSRTNVTKVREQSRARQPIFQRLVSPTEVSQDDCELNRVMRSSALRFRSL